MKANESIEKYPARVREYTNYAIKSVKNVAKLAGPRPAGSEGDKKAREYFKADLAKFCDEYKEEAFKCSDKAFMSWVVLGVILLVLSTIFFVFGMPIVSLALAILNLVSIVGEFILYRQVLDVFFKKKESANLIGVRKASGETKKRIILCGHTDSAFEWTYTYHGGRPMVAFIIVVAVISVIVSIVASAIAVFQLGAVDVSVVFMNDNVLLTVFAVIMLVLLPFQLMALAFSNFKRPVVGANDDLTGCFISLAVAKFLSDNDIRFENTEVQVLLAGAEEAGLRGSKAYVKAHKDELIDENVETVFVGFDTVHDFDFMQIITKDLNGFAKADERVVNLIKQGAEIAEYDNVSKGPISLGSTDATAFIQQGVPAATFVAMDPTPAKYYHTRLDTEENLEPKAIEAGVKIALETTFLFDEKGI